MTGDDQHEEHDDHELVSVLGRDQALWIEETAARGRAPGDCENQ